MGTNYLESLLATNLDVRLLPGTVPRSFLRQIRRLDRLDRRLRLPWRSSEIIRDLWFRRYSGSNLGWKHMLVSSGAFAGRTIADETTFVTITKNPYS